MDVYQYFTAACYKGFGNDSNSFYAVYGKVFDQLATEDIEFMDSPDDYENIPKFGTSTSDYETIVGPFYAYWQSYCTKKTYTWLCQHNIQEIRDRRILREIEKETKKIAQKARKERNDEVRALVSFVRKRDKRVQEYKKILEERAEQNRLKQQQHRLAQLRKNQQEALAMQNSHQSVFNTSDHEAQLREMEQAYGSDSDDSDYDDLENEADTDNEDELNGEDDAELYLDDLYCVACNKSFKNESSYENHESSKKHRENTERLRKQMQQEEEENAAEQNGDNHIDSDLDQVDDEILDAHDHSDVEEVVTKKKSTKKSKKGKNKPQIVQHHSDEGDDDDNIAEDHLEEMTKPMTDMKIGNVSSDDKDNWSDDAGKKGKKSKNKKANNKKLEKNLGPMGAEPTNGFDCNEADTSKKPNKKSKKTTEKSIVNEADDGGPSVDTSHTCVTCQSTFDSKNKLFTHLKKTNHGVYLPKPTASEPKRGKRK